MPSRFPHPTLSDLQARQNQREADAEQENAADELPDAAVRQVGVGHSGVPDLPWKDDHKVLQLTEGKGERECPKG